MIKSTKPHRSLAAVLAFLAVILNVNSICGQVPAAERQALIDLYTTTDGPNWTNNTNWNTSAPVSEWYGVGISSDNRVTTIQLPYNNLNGNFPNSILQFTYLKDLILEGNQLSGEPPLNNQGKLSNLRLLSLTNNKLTGRILQNLGYLPNLEFFYIGNNEFIFSDLEPNFGTFDTALGGSFGYSPQAKVDEAATRSVMTGNTITLSSTALTSSNNRYQWYKDGIAIAGATNKNFVISNANSSDVGVYALKATNSKVTNLEIERNPITVVVEPIEDCVSAAERQALVDLYNVTDGGNWTNTLAGNKPWLVNDPTSSVCDWFGVSVTNGKVTKLDLPNNNLNGEIPRSINQLQGLILLSLHTNQLSGSMPRELGQLTALRRLWLNKNRLSGSIPAEIGQLINLQDFNLSLNQLSGNIPAELGQLTNLKKLFLSDNQFTGNIPNELGQLTNLITLNLHQNQLSGNIPVALGQLTKLLTLNVYRNQLGGSIPMEIGQLTKLAILNLFKNQLSGSIPLEIGQLTSLRDLNLGSNQLSGTIPTTIGNLNKLTSIKLHGNQLSGGIPDTIQQLTLLQRLFLDNNSLQGKIPDISGFASLNALRIEKNAFVFSSFESEFSAYKTKMGNNFRYTPQTKVDQLETQSVVTGGSITLTSNVLTSPNNSYQWYKNNRVITGATNKELVITNANGIDAGVYFFRATNSIVTNLRLERNPITLSVVQNTDCVSATERQALIDLYNATDGANWRNTKNGDKPWLVNDPNSSVCDWFGVTVVDGTIITLNLKSNWLLVGEIPLTITLLRNLEVLDLSSNDIAGDLPQGIGQLTRLKKLLLGDNELIGSIPIEIGQLKELEFLGLGSNKLTGNIPSELGQLTKLINISLHANQFTGSIPSELTQLNNLRGLTLFRNQLSGTAPNFSGMAHLQGLSLESNKFVFSDLESTFQSHVAKFGNQFRYLFQAKTDLLETLTLTEGQSITLTSNALTSLNNSYQWYKNGVAITGAVNKNLVISNAGPSDKGNYTLKAINSVVTNLELERHSITLSVEPSVGCVFSRDRQALIDFYNAANGDQWTNTQTGNKPWLINDPNSSVCDWYGVTAVNGKVTGIALNNNGLTNVLSTTLNQLTDIEVLLLSDNQLSGNIPDLAGLKQLLGVGLANNQLSGSIPPSLNQLPKLAGLILNGNQLTGKVPNFSGVPMLELFHIQNNNFTFLDFETEFNAYQTKMGANFKYAPQDKVDLTVTQSVAPGDPITLSSDVLTSPNNSYQWYKDGVAITGATTKDLLITNASDTDTGVYTFKATNSVVTNLELERNPITLTIGSGSVCNVSAAERQALIDLYNATNGDNWTNTLASNKPWLVNDPNSKVCDWYGITVTNGSVISISLEENNLRGEIPISIENLSNLDTISLSKNEILGSLPIELGQLTSLRVIWLHNNQISGFIPVELGQLPILEQLVLSNNLITGSIPKELSELTKLRILWLNNNEITGSIPQELGLLTNLEVLNLNINQISGFIPGQLGGLINLRTLNLGYNLLDEGIPIELCQLSKLETLSLNHNQLSGSIPSCIGQLSLLKNLILSSNQLEGSIPEELNQLSSIQVIGFVINKFKGEIKLDIDRLPNLSALGIHQNKFIFSDFETRFDDYKTKLAAKFLYIPQDKVDQTETQSVATGGTITLTSNVLTSPNNSYQWFKDGVAITGAIEKDLVITNASDSDAGVYTFKATNSVVTNLELERNPITLTIGSGSTCTVSTVERQALIDLYNATNGDSWANTLAGNKPWLINDPSSSVCDWYGVKVTNGKVDRLELFTNDLTGEIPNKIGQLINLNTLLLHSNQLSGSIPAGLGQLINLQILRLGNNRLTGEIPSELGSLNNLTAIYLEHNSLTGNIPTELGQLANLSQIYLNHNQLTGSIPTELGNLSKLQVFRLDNNQLTGKIPIELGQLIDLSQFFLSYNELTGSIPAELGKLTNLRVLRLNDNQLTGEIPSKFGDLISLKDLVLSSNQLSGDIPAKLGQLTNLESFLLQFNQLSGSIPAELIELTNLQIIRLENNQLVSKIPDFSSTVALISFLIQNNKFVFSDFETEFSAYQTKMGSDFKYIPQAKVDQTETQSVALGESSTLTSNVLTSLNNNYQWYKDGVAITGATEKELRITDASDTDAGVYTFKATNSIVANLELERNPITLTIGSGSSCAVSAAERQALIDLYNTTDGDNWKNTLAGNQAWLINDPSSSVCDWHGVTANEQGVIGIELTENDLLGYLPNSLQELSSLKKLLLDGNQLSQGIPQQLGQLTNLESLLLQSNTFSGRIPSQLSQLKHLRTLVLSNNLLSGNIPAGFNELSNLVTLWVDNNQLSGRIPDLSNIPSFFTFKIQDNKFVFSDFESEFTNYKSKMGSLFQYTPQAKVDLTVTQSVAPGRDIPLTSNVLISPNNSYQWYKDGIAITGAIEKELVITNASDTDAGVYTFKATNSIVTNLELERNPITLVIGDPGGTDCTNLLDAFAVDTSFESAVSVVINGRNETLGATGWDIGEGTPDTFLPPFTTEPSGDPFISYTFNSAPNGGICAGALRRGNNTESFSKELSGLIPGTTYVVEFYQANATRLLIPELLEEAYGYWEVRLGSEPQYTTPMQPNSLIPAWQRARLEFTATTAIQRIEFLAASSAADTTNSYPVYVLIDGIRFYKKPQATDIACSDLEIQSFCNLIFEEPTVDDLVSPLTGTTSWYKEQIGGIPYDTETLLSDLGTTIFWADNDSGASRVPIEVIFDLGAPDGEGYQSFDIYDTPTISDLIASGENISWYTTPAGTVALVPSTPLVHENTYYAAQGTNSCRLAVEVAIQVPQPIGSGLQTFCSTTNPTVANLLVQPTRSEYNIIWYHTATGTQTYTDTTPLEHGKIYYATQINGIEETIERFPVKVNIINTDSTPRIYERDVAVPLESTVGTLTSFFKLDTNMVWYNLPTGGRPYENTDILFDGKTYYARIGNEPCDASEIIAVTVQIGEIEQPEQIRCIKFVPRPGDHYVISGWAREDALITAESNFKNFDEVSPLFLDLLTYLKNKVLNNESLPEIYVLKSDPDAPNVDGLLPFIKNKTTKKVTVYDFKLEREITEGVKRTIGFSFSLDSAKTHRYTYITPEVAYDLFGNIYKLGYHYPLLNNPSLTINFKKASVCETNFCITSDFTIDSDFPFLKTMYKDDVSERSSLSGIEPSIMVFTYEEDPDYQVMDYLNTTIELLYKDGDENVIPMDSNTVVFAPNGPIIDGWQRITADFKIPTNAANLTISLKNKGRQVNAYFDDVRIYPFNGNMKSFVYDRITQRLMAELDENNYATFYEYDKEGGLVRVKKETEGGTYTIQETRSASSKIKR